MAGRTPALVASPPPPHSAKKKRKSTLRVATEIVLALLFFEFFAYQKLLGKMEIEEMQLGENKVPPNEAPLSPEENRKRRKAAKQQHGQQEQQTNNHNRLAARKYKEERQKEKKERQKEKKEQQKFNLTITSGEDDAEAGTDRLSPADKEDRLKTANRLEHMRVSGDILLSELPPWSQILENYNSYSNDDEPVVLGLEHCEEFRNSNHPQHVGVGPAGLFSTGTNLVASLFHNNCVRSNDRPNQKFALIQVPWGKHNPADARFHHQVKNPRVLKREAILPIVAIRHPYSWMSAMCKVSYRTRWKHRKDQCHESLFLKNPILDVPWGFKEYNETHKVKNSYDSLAHMWLEWNKPYFLDAKYNQTPRLMVRHEDIVYRPEKVVQKICECVGGTNFNENPDWQHPDGFEYEEESANRGQGHGRHGRSGLYTAVVKYGQPIRNWYEQYTASDRQIMKEVFQGEADPALRKIFETFQYRLFDDVEEPTKAEKMRARKRAFLELKAKEAALKAVREAEREEEGEK